MNSAGRFGLSVGGKISESVMVRRLLDAGVPLFVIPDPGVDAFPVQANRLGDAMSDFDGLAAIVAVGALVPAADVFAPVRLWTRNIRNVRNVGGHYACYARYACSG